MTHPKSGSTNLFSAAAPSAKRRLKRLAVLVAVAVTVLGAVAVAATGSDGPTGYRSALVTQQSVQETIDGVAVIAPTSQASVSFPVSGTVEHVRVAEGSNVQIGQSLATLDAQDLQEAVRSQQAALDQAELNLERALNGEEVAGPAGSRSPQGPSNALASEAVTSGQPSGTALAQNAAPPAAAQPAPGATQGASSNTTSNQEIREAAQRIVDAQRRAGDHLAQAEAALAEAQRICDQVTTSPTTTTTTPPTTTTAPATTTTSTDAPTPTTPSQNANAPTSPTPDAVAPDAVPPAPSPEACTDALERSLDAQRTATASTQDVTAAADAYTTLISATPPARDSSAPADTADGGTPARTGSSPDSATGRSEQQPSTPANTVSAEDLIAYQKAVTAAEAQLAVAEQAVDQATIVSPIAGTIVAVNLTVGDDITAGSATANIVIKGEGAYEATTQISVDRLPDVEVGQTATLQPDGTDSTISGTVVSVGVTGSASGPTTTYPVVIGLAGDNSELGNGATGSVAIVTDEATNALAVPSSALTTNGDRSTVTILEDGETKQVTVTIGATGSRWIEIREGLREGQRVVLADLSQPLPNSATEAPAGGQQSGPGGGRFPGGGRGPGGIGGRPGG